VHGGKASKGRKAPRGNVVTRERLVRKDRTASGISGNVVNPRVGYALQYTRPGREEETGEVAQNHEVGTRMRRGSRIPKEVERPGNRAGGLRELTPWRAIRRRGDLWTIPREEARTTGQETGTPWGTTTERKTAYQPEFEPQDRVASGKTARRSTGRACIPNQVVCAQDDGPRRQRRWQPPLLEGHGGQQRRPTSRSIILCFPSSPRAPCLRGVKDDEQEGGSPSRNGRSESSGEPSQEGMPMLGDGEPRQRWFPPGRNHL